MLQKSVENFAENDVKFKELLKDIVREELKSYKEHNDKQIQIIFEKLQLYREDLRITYKLIQEIIELFGLHKENSELHRKKVDEILSKLQMDFEIYQKEIYPKELFEILKKMEAKFQTQRKDINIIAESLRNFKKDIIELFKDQMNTFDSILADLAEMWEEQIYKKENKTIFEEEEMENDNEALSIKQKIEREIENLDKVNSNKVEILATKGSSDGK